MKVVERNGEKYLVLLEEPEPVEMKIYELVEELPDGSVRVRFEKGGPVITIGPPKEAGLTDEDIKALDDLEKAEEEWENEYLLNDRQEAILRYLFERREPVPFKEIVNYIVQRYDVSAPMVQKDVERLLKEMLIEKVSRGLYKISKSGMSYLGATPPGLYYECVESGLLKAIEMVLKAEKEGKVPEDLYMTLVDALDCLRDLGRMYQREWDIEVPLD